MATFHKQLEMMRNTHCNNSLVEIPHNKQWHTPSGIVFCYNNIVFPRLSSGKGEGKERLTVELRHEDVLLLERDVLHSKGSMNQLQW